MKYGFLIFFLFLSSSYVFADFPQTPMQPIHIAAEKGDLATLVALVDAGVDVNLYCFKGRPLDLAVFSNQNKVVRYLISKNALPGSNSRPEKIRDRKSVV